MSEVSAPENHGPIHVGTNSRRVAPSLLEAQGLMKTYGGRTVVNNVHLSVREGEIVGLLGPNGAGKTTSFYMIAGLIPPDAGVVTFSGKDISTLPMHKRARLGMGYLPQEESIFRHLSVENNLKAVLETRKDLSRKQRNMRIDELLERFSITHIRKSEALALSGGEKRRLTLARSLCTNPSLLMLDEPFSGVDPIAVGDIQSIVRDLRDNDGLSILITDHNVRETLHIVDHAYLLYEGKLILEGEAADIANDPLARKHYLGEDFVL
ncbi:LPS export ABC transporter ATP-binding protein [Verrucomicrobiaceae bacterium N1E253]|uniref:LPS export ABC transporter ATP-binding protein n=1 Tax=Oceaniferula marina TaxID=2748318 RepID=A0A851GDC7_9BACT|nr:LPS export ABC transporter ATP-binding protein [Oceaniferula marina]NWK55416.1 LPS export ABC transporter ATP-binding protein [Oceaniferula marina]